MKLHYFLLIFMFLGCNSAAQVTFRNDTDKALTIYIYTDPKNLNTKSYKLTPKESLIHKFDDSKQVKIEVSAGYPVERLFWPTNQEDYLKAFSDPANNFIIPITYDKQKDTIAIGFPNYPMIQKLLIEKHQEAVVEATPELPAGVGRIIGEYCMPEEMYQAAGWFKKATPANKE